ncbi:MAG: Hpt domain-containing protein [Firmicutes bacterium]|nr:Hpt domain-containing protein [Bacillota bacterium]
MNRSGSDPFAELRRQYRAEAASRAAFFAAAARALREAGAGGTDLAALRQAAHRLAGSAGIYGFPEVGRKARALEEALLPVLQEGAPLDAQRVADLTADLAQLLAALGAGEPG